MTTKRQGQHWYQVNKSRFQNEAINSSVKVRMAKQAVQEAEDKLNLLKVSFDDSLTASFRRTFFGKNPSEISIEECEKSLFRLKIALNEISREVAREAGRAYGEDWASRNPDKAKKHTR
jgi:hypothetical protein